MISECRDALELHNSPRCQFEKFDGVEEFPGITPHLFVSQLMLFGCLRQFLRNTVLIQYCVTLSAMSSCLQCKRGCNLDIAGLHVQENNLIMQNLQQPTDTAWEVPEQERRGDRVPASV